MGEPFELSGADAHAFISLVETGETHDREVYFGGALGDLPPAELAPYFAPCTLSGWLVADKKAGWAVKPKVAGLERDKWALVAPDGSGLGGEARTPAGPRRTLDELRRVVDAAKVSWRSPELARAREFLFRGAAPSAGDVALADKLAAKLKLDGGGDLLHVEEGAKHKLRCLPSDLSPFAAARRLTLYNCGIRQLSDAVLALPALTELTTMYTPISWITPRLGELRALTKLTLDGAAMSELPAGLGALPLRSLVLRNCRWLRRLPSDLTSLRTLEQLVLAGCPAHGEGMPATRDVAAVPPDTEAAAIVNAIRAANPACTITLR